MTEIVKEYLRTDLSMNSIDPQCFFCHTKKSDCPDQHDFRINITYDEAADIELESHVLVCVFCFEAVQRIVEDIVLGILEAGLTLKRP